MRQLAIAAIVMSIVLSACQPAEGTETSSPATTSVVHTPSPANIGAESAVSFSRSGLNVEIPRPEGWESFTTDYGIVIAEKFPTVADHGKLQGLMAYVFVTPLVEFPFVIDDNPGRNSALQVLTGIAEDASASGSAHVTDAEGFVWAGYDAAYYLLSEPSTGLRTLVIGVTLPESNVLLTCAVSAPHEAAARIRDILPVLLGGLILNTHAIGVDALDSMPETLEFPE